MSRILSAVLSLSLLAVPVLASTETMTSPGIGALDSRFSAMGGIIIDVIGANGKRLTAQVPPSKLSNGWAPASDHFYSVWTQGGFDAYTLQTLLGGGLTKVNIRVTLQDGDSGSPNPVYTAMFGAGNFPYRTAGGYPASQPAGYDFDAGTDLYVAIRLADGSYINAGYMGLTTTYRLDAGGNNVQSFTGFPGVYALTDSAYSSVTKPPQYTPPFAVTGWFSVPSQQLGTLYQTLTTQSTMPIGLWDTDPGDQYYDFTQGTGDDVVDIPLIPAHIISFSATPSAVFGSGSVKLSWQTQAATSVSIDNSVTVDPTSVNGSTTVQVSTPSTYTLTATGTGGTDTARVTVQILPPLAGATTTLPNGLAGTAYSTSLAATGGTTPYAWTVASGSLPSGLSLATNGTIRGIPTTAGTASFMAQVVDSSNPAQTVTIPLSLTITAALAITTKSFPNAVLGSPYAQPIQATGGTAPYLWSLSSGTLPPGLTLNTDGSITGTPTTSGSSTFTVHVIDSTTPTAQSASQSYSLTVGSQLSIQTTTLPTSTVGAPYAQTLVAAGGTTPYTWSLESGPLPDGLSLSPEGIISGSPTTPGLATIIVRCTDRTTPAAQTASQLLTVYVVSPLIIDTTTLPAGVASHPYAAALNVHNGVQPYLWTLVSGSLPPGLQLLASGAVIGTPSTAGDYTFILKASDSSVPTSLFATQSYTLHISAAFTITTTALPAGTTGLPYTAGIQATAGTPPYSVAVVFGTLPPGLVLNPDGTIGGTPTAPGTYNLFIRATDSSSPAPQISERAYAIAIDANLTIVTPTLPDGTESVTYNQTLTAINGTQPYNWSVATGTLPPGLSLLQSGAIIGTPTKDGNYTFTVQVKDASQPSATTTRAYTIRIALPLILTNDTLPNGIIDLPYTAVLSTTGGIQPYTYSLATEQPFPPGLSLSAIGVISGTPTTAGSFAFTIRVTDSGATPAHVDKTYTVGINEPLSIPDPHLPAGITGALYTQQLAPAGGFGPYTWSLASGSLPTGLTLLNPGILIGTPTTKGESTFTLQVKDSTPGSPQTATLTITLPVYAPLVLPDQALAPVMPNVAYSATITATGGVAPYSWTLAAGSLPAGLSLASNGTISGTTAVSGSYPVTVAVSDSEQPAQSVSREYVLLVDAPFAITTTSPMRPAIVGHAYSQPLSFANGKTPFACSVTAGSLASGLALDADGTIKGNAAAIEDSQFVVSCKDAAGQTALKTLTLSVQQALSIVASTVPPVIVGVPYYHAFTPAGGTAGYIWSISAGQLPPGLSLTTDGLLSGMATASRKFTLTVSVTDSSSPAQSAVLPVSLSVTPALSAIPQQFTATTGTAFRQTAVAIGGTGPFTWTIASGSLPPGLQLATSGAISGTPLAAGSFAAVLTVADNSSQSAAAYVTFTVAEALAIPLASMPVATVGAPYAAALYAMGGTPPYLWTVANGSLPSGLSLSVGGGITGVPTKDGSFNFTVTVATGTQLISRQLTITVNPAPAQLSIPASSAALARGTVGVLYRAGLVVTGATPPVKWTLSSGSLPPGLALDASGSISGTPATAGTFSFGLTVRDADGKTASGNYVLTIAPPLAITTTDLGKAGVSASYALSLAASGGTLPYTWNLASGSIPAGLYFSKTGVLSGTPTTAGSYSFALSVTDASAAPLVTTRSFTLSVGGAFSITTTTLPAATASAPYTTTLSAANGTAPYAWSLADGQLPPGLALSTNGALAGTPTKDGTWAVIIKATDAAAQTATRQLLITVQPTLSITSTPRVSFNASTLASLQLAASGGMVPYTWRVASGALPAGLSLTPSGAFTGTPTTPGSASATIEVADSQQHKASVLFTITISDAQLPTLAIAPDGRSLEPSTQHPVSLTLASPATTALSGTLAVAGNDDQDLGFIAAGSAPVRSLTFSIKAGSTTASFPSGSPVLQTGTVASAITLTATITNVSPTPSTTATNRLLANVPTITGGHLEKTANGFDLVLEGYSNTRDMSAATFRFYSSANAASAPFTLTVTDLFKSWYASPASRGSGVFSYRQPFSISGGSLTLSAVEATLTNSVGTSPAFQITHR